MRVPCLRVESESAADCFFGFNADLPALDFGQFPGDEKTKAGSAVLRMRSSIRLLEFAEDLVRIPVGDASAAVNDTVV